MRLFALPLLLTIAVPAFAASDVQALSAEAAALIPPFQQQLLETVKGAMQAGGPSKAVEACQTLAPEIAAKNSQNSWKVGRTALKVRNPNNAPDSWERTVLEEFAAQAAAGTPVTELKKAEIVDGQFRMMKAIPTGEPCLACHGKDIKPELAAVIDQRYPADQARGFSLGELRGAFTLSRPLP